MSAGSRATERGAAADDPTDYRRCAATCRELLPRVSRTFAVTISVLGGSMRDAVRTGYLLCRIADTIEDAWPGDRREVEGAFDRFTDALAGVATAASSLQYSAIELRGRVAEPYRDLVRSTGTVLATWRALPPGDRADVADAVRVMAGGMRHYAGREAAREAELHVTGPHDRAAPAPGGARATDDSATVARFAYLDDDRELADYCWIVAGCVGVMLTKLFDRRAGGDPRAAARRLELAPAVGEALQLTNILLDWPADVREGRCHVPASWLRDEGLEPRDLVGPPHPGVERLAARLEARARAAIAIVPQYIATLPARHVRYRMFCLWPALWAAASLAHARRDPEFPRGATRPKLPRPEIRRIARAALLRGHTRAGVVALFRSVGIEPAD